MFNLLAEGLAAPRLTETPSGLWELQTLLPALQPGCDFLSWGRESVLTCRWGRGQQEGRHTPGQNDPSSSEAPPPHSPPFQCKIHIPPLTRLVAASSCRCFKPVTFI